MAVVTSTCMTVSTNASKTPDKRARLYRAEMLCLPRAELQAMDRDDVETLPVYRRHYTQNQTFYMGAWGTLLNRKAHTLTDVLPHLDGHEFDEDDLARLKAYCDGFGFEKASRLLNYSCSLDPADDGNARRIGSGLFHALLRSIYLKADRKQHKVTIDGHRQSRMTYTVIQDLLDTLRQDLEYRRQYREKQGVYKFCSPEHKNTKFVDSRDEVPIDSTVYEAWQAQIEAIPPL